MTITTRNWLETFCIRAGYQINPNPIYCDDTYIDRIYQPDVYKLARKWMLDTGATTLIDVGCGQGHKLKNLPYSVIGIDTGLNLEVCRKLMPRSTWIDCDLEKEFPVLDADTLSNSVVICADVIEHLVDPTILIRALTNYSQYAKAVIISTPDRDVVYGYDHNGPPFNPGHVREWNISEFLALLSRWFTIEQFEHTNVDNVRGELQTITVALTRKL